MLIASSGASIIAFSAVAAVLVLTPGVGTTFLMSTVIRHGRSAGYLTAIGMTLGAAIHATVAALGTAVLLARFPRALTWIGIVGGTFIVLLGVRGIWLAFIAPAARVQPDSPRRPHGIVVTGLLIALSNAPIPLFYFVVVPHYIPASMSHLTGAVLLSSIHLAMAFTWMTTVVTIVGMLADVLRRPRVLRGAQLVTGSVLVALGAQAVLSAT